MFESYFLNLKGHQYLALSTRRINGEVVLTPVWFVQDGEIIYVWTGRQSGKVKRLKANPEVFIGPCDFRGTLLGAQFDALASVHELSENERVEDLFIEKYAEQFSQMVAQDPQSKSQVVFLSIIPPI